MLFFGNNVNIDGTNIHNSVQHFQDSTHDNHIDFDLSFVIQNDNEEVDVLCNENFVLRYFPTLFYINSSHKNPFVTIPSFSLPKNALLNQDIYVLAEVFRI